MPGLAHFEKESLSDGLPEHLVHGVAVLGRARLEEGHAVAEGERLRFRPLDLPSIKRCSR